MKVVLTALNAKYIHSSLALRYLKAYCSSESLDIVLKEYTVNNGTLDILSDIFREEPDVLALSCYIWNIDMALALAGLVKKVLPQTVIVLGGPEVSYNSAEILQQHRYIDYVVQGEGEQVFRAFLMRLAKQEGVSHIPGLALRQGNNIVVNGGPQVMADLDAVPFPYSDEDAIQLKDKIIYYESSRGCPFSCQYCLSSATQGVRFFSLDRACRDLEFFIKHDVKQVKFVDRTFNVDKERYIAIWRFLAGQNCRTNFHFEIAADLLDDEIITFLRGVPEGRFQFEIGVQSTYEKTLSEICRTNDWERIVQNVKELRSYDNIHLHLDLIVGLPREDWGRFAQSFNDVYSLEPHMLQMGFLKLLKGSGIRERAAEFGYVFTDNAPYEVLANSCLSYAEVRKLKIIEELFNQVYNSGRFRNILLWLIENYGGNAFSFYCALAEYWDERGLNLLAHSAKSLFKYLFDFWQAAYPDTSDICQEFLKFDALLSEGGVVRPEFLNWNGTRWSEEKSNFWRNETIVQRHIPDFKFVTWREVNRKYHIEVFAANIPAYIEQRGSIRQESTVVLFDYHDGKSRYQVLDSSDFWQAGGRDNDAV